MSAPPVRGRASFVERFLRVRSIRTKLAIGFGVLLALGAFNIGVYYWGAHQRARVFRELQRAIERQIIITEVTNLLEDQKKFVDLMAGVIGVQEASPPGEAERRHFARGVDTVAVRLEDLAAHTGPAGQPTVEALRAKVEALAASWKAFYDYQWSDPARAVEELYVRAEPLAAELLTEALPAAVQREKEQLARANADFIRTDRTFERFAWTSFILSALIGALLAFFISRDLLRAISALKAGAEKIGAGQLGHRIRIPNRDELGDVAESFNQMTERLDQRTAELAAKRDQVEAQRDDLTRTLEHLKATQAQLIQAEKMASLGQLTAGIAHEIKNPLNFVNNFAQLSAELVDELEAELASNAEKKVADVRDDLQVLLHDLKLNAEKINEHGRRADGIVRSMLLHSRGTPGQRQEVDLNALIDEYVNLAYHGMRAQVADFNVKIERAYDARIGRVSMVPQEMGRVFINLLHNAFYAVHEKQHTCNGPYEPTVSVSTQDLEGRVEIRIRDNGTGIPEAVRKKIFEPFFTTKPSGVGTGLGLFLSYDIVTHGHGGSLRVETEEGCYTEFIVELPKKAAGGTA